MILDKNSNICKKYSISLYIYLIWATIFIEWDLRIFAKVKKWPLVYKVFPPHLSNVAEKVPDSMILKTATTNNDECQGFQRCKSITTQQCVETVKFIKVFLLIIVFGYKYYLTKYSSD